MFRLTIAVRKALYRAREAASSRLHAAVTPVHILAGLHSSGALTHVLEDLEIDGEGLAAELDGRLSTEPAAARSIDLAGRAYAKEAHAVLERAGEIAVADGADALASSHLLMALLEVCEDCAQVAARFGFSLERLRGRTGERDRQAACEPSTSALAKSDASAWFLQLEAEAESPLYLQVITAIEEAVAIGRLLPDERLPSVRDLAAELGIAPGTVARAYALLEERGVVVTDGARGTWVAARDATSRPREQRLEALELLLRPVAVAGFHLGATDSDIRSALERAIARLRRLQSR